MTRSTLILYSQPKGASLPFKEDKYRLSYERLYSMGEKVGLIFYRAPFEWYDSKNNRFSKAWSYKNGKWQQYTDIQPDVIYDKTSTQEKSREEGLFLARKYPLLNDPEFTRSAGNKYLASRLVPEFFKPYIRVKDHSELEDALRRIPANRIVLKPELGSGGRGIFIGSPQKALTKELFYPILVQEFIDGSGGVPGQKSGLHDLRVVYLNEEPLYSYIRTPAQGKLLANVAQGGKMEIIPLGKLPSSIIPVAAAVQRAFSKYKKKIYTIDFIFDLDQKPWIVELNTKPGIYFEPGQEETRDFFYGRLIQMLKGT